MFDFCVLQDLYCRLRELRRIRDIEVEEIQRALNKAREELAGSQAAAEKADSGRGAAVEARDVFRQQVWRTEGVEHFC